MNNAIFVIVNNNHFEYMITMLNSLLVNWKNYPTILCNYDSDLPEDKLDKLRTYPNLKLVPLELKDNEVGVCPSYKTSGMLIAYGKLKIWSESYDMYDNILLMDVDTIVLNPLDELIENTELSIFRDCNKLAFLKKTPELRDMLIEDGISDYFNANFRYDGEAANSGIIMVPKKYRSKENHDYLMYLLNRYKDYNIWADQAIVNLWMLKNNVIPTNGVMYNFLTLYLDPKSDYWKDKDYHSEFSKELESVSIMHFALKPQHILNQKYLADENSSTYFSKKILDIYEKYQIRY